MQKVDRGQARAALTNALARRRGAPIGTPLQELYASAPDRATPTKALTFFGYEMEVALPELVSCEIHAHGVIEPAVTALFIEILQAETIVFDVGAHLGYYSLLAAHLGATVHAFEPSRQTRAILERNACDGVDVISLGLWSEETTLRFNDFGRGHSAINTFFPSPKDETLAGPEASYDVRVTTIDRHVADSGAIPQIIKIDVEGAEPAVLQGARRTIAAARPLITMEVGDTTASRTSRDAVDLAIDLGYVPYDLSEGGVRPHVPHETYDYGNLLLVPRGTAPPALPAL